MTSSINPTHCYNEQKLLSTEQALQQLLDYARPVTTVETLPLLEAEGRVLAQPIISTINVPPLDNSAMDGYAMNSDDLIKANGKPLVISHRICAGDSVSTLPAGQVVRIFTGAPIPKGANTVIMQEHCEVIGNTIGHYPKQAANVNIRQAGEDITAGTTLLPIGQVIRPQEMGLIASIGLATVEVFRPLRVSIFFTGDELIEAGTESQVGKIYNSNRYTLNGLLQRLGCQVNDLGIIEDKLSATKDALQLAAKNADLVITSGGVSVGEEDHVKKALEEIGSLTLWKIKMKPGKPVAYGNIDGTPFLGLPGNPVSTFVTCCLFAKPYIQRCQGQTKLARRHYSIPAGFNHSHKGGRAEYIRVRMMTDEKGKPVLERFTNQGSGVLTSASWADGLALIKEDIQVTQGDLLPYFPMNELI
ncbi:MAG: molybdopterin molybdotransferase MoeA [Thiotrichaceae bacterium]|nr:molybdopterin molybdotransferase MoeA [Thiotrichaceae bacterium]